MNLPKITLTLLIFYNILFTACDKERTVSGPAPAGLDSVNSRSSAGMNELSLPTDPQLLALYEDLGVKIEYSEADQEYHGIYNKMFNELLEFVEALPETKRNRLAEAMGIELEEQNVSFRWVGTGLRIGGKIVGGLFIGADVVGTGYYTSKGELREAVDYIPFLSDIANTGEFVYVGNDAFLTAIEAAAVRKGLDQQLDDIRDRLSGPQVFSEKDGYYRSQAFNAQVEALMEDYRESVEAMFLDSDNYGKGLPLPAEVLEKIEEKIVDVGINNLDPNSLSLGELNIMCQALGFDDPKECMKFLANSKRGDEAAEKLRNEIPKEEQEEEENKDNINYRACHLEEGFTDSTGDMDADAKDPTSNSYDPGGEYCVVTQFPGDNAGKTWNSPLGVSCLDIELRLRQLPDDLICDEFVL